MRSTRGQIDSDPPTQFFEMVIGAVAARFHNGPPFTSRAVIDSKAATDGGVGNATTYSLTTTNGERGAMHSWSPS